MRPLTVLRLALAGSRSDRLRLVLTVLGTAVATMVLMAALNVVELRALDVPGPPAGTVAIVTDGGWQFRGSPDELDQHLADEAAERGMPVEDIDYRPWDPAIDSSWFNSYGRYQSALLDEPGLHTGVVVTALALLVPLVLFVGQCARIGAPQRDRRLAALRMSGATPRQAALVAVVESSSAAALGALVGVLAFVLLRALDPQTPDAAGRLRWPTDVAIPWWHYGAVVVLVPMLVAVGTRIALRTVSISPFGVLRHRPTHAPATLPVALLVAGLGAFAAVPVVGRLTGGGNGVFVVMFAGVVMVVGGLATGAAATAQRLGRMLARSTRSPAALIAGRRADRAPFQASRPATAVLLAVLIAAGVTQTRVNFVAQADPGDTFYASTFDLLNIVLAVGLALSLAGLIVVVAESVVTRRRTLAALVASGTPRGTIRRSIVIETLIAVVPLTVVAAAAGTIAPRAIFGGSVAHDGREIPVGVPWLSLSVIVVGTVAAAFAVTAVGLLFLPASTSPRELRTAA